MGCGCQDKERDAEIIAYYNSKKQNMKSEVIDIIKISWEGELCDFRLYIPSENQIRSIEKINNQWVATIENI